MNIQEVLENNGFDVNKTDSGYEVHQYTPEGEDWYLTFDKLEYIVDYAMSYEPEEDFKVWVEAKLFGRDKTIPPIPELWKDQLWKQEILLKTAREIMDN